MNKSNDVSNKGSKHESYTRSNTATERKSFFYKLYLRYLLLFIIATSFIYPFIPAVYRFDLIRSSTSFIILGLFFAKIRRYNKPAKLIIAFTMLVVLMAVVNYFKQKHFDVVSLKILTTSLFFIVGYNLVNTKAELLYFIKTFYYGLLFVLGIILVFNILGVESKSIYGSEVAIFGPQGTNITKGLPLLLFPSLLLFNYNISKPQKNILYFLIVVSIILVLIGQKRGTILGLASGFMVYLAFQYYNPKGKKTVKMLIIIGILLFASSFLYWDIVEQVYLSRQERYSFIVDGNTEALETEARYWEIRTVTSDLKNRSVFEVLFGIGFGSWQRYWGTKRMLHTDYIMFLNDIGVVGLFLYLSIYYAIFQISRKHKNYLKNKDPNANGLFLLIVTIIVISLVLAISGFSHGTNLRAYALLFLGGAMGYLNHQRKEMVMNSAINM